MKKLIIGILCCAGLLMLTIASGVDTAVDAKPEITSVVNLS